VLELRVIVDALHDLAGSSVSSPKLLIWIFSLFGSNPPAMRAYNTFLKNSTQNLANLTAMPILQWRWRQKRTNRPG
jgi:hypothetical protein